MGDKKGIKGGDKLCIENNKVYIECPKCKNNDKYKITEYNNPLRGELKFMGECLICGFIDSIDKFEEVTAENEK